MEEFLSKWYGILAFVLFDLIALTVVICITYRWFFKRFFDFFLSLFCILLLSSIYIITALVIRSAVKAGRVESVLTGETFVGKKGKKITLHAFSLGKLKKLPRLFDVFFGRLSFIGVMPLKGSDCTFLDEDEEERLTVRTGLINPLVTTGDEDTDYDDMIQNDVRYARRFSFFGDCKIFFTWLIGKIRGNGNGYLGKTRETSYAKALLDEGRITQEDYRVACEEEN